MCAMPVVTGECATGDVRVCEGQGLKKGMNLGCCFLEAQFLVKFSGWV